MAKRPMTITEKIFAKHAGLESVKAGDLITAKVDITLANDITGPVAIKEFKKIGAEKVFDKTRTVFVPDHFVPNKDIKSAEQAKYMREFVKEQKKKKMNKMLGDTSNSGTTLQNPMFGSNPFAIGDPFGIPRPMSNSPKGGFDVDDLVKRIDAKIAELEEEERKEKEAETKKMKTQNNQVPENNQESIKEAIYEPVQVTESTPVNKEIKENNSETINIEELSKESKDLYLDNTDDENFFDDFFFDE